MFKIIILAAIAGAASAQFGHNRGPAERQLPPGDSEEPSTPEYEGNVRMNPRHRPRAYEQRNVGGFQNGNFAPHDGRLKTNLNSGRGAGEHRQNNFQQGPYVVEGAAFRIQENRFVDSSQGNPADDSHDANNQQRREGQNIKTQDRRRLEQPLDNNGRISNTNKRQNEQNVGHYDQSVVRANNDRNRFTNQETNNENNRGLKISKEQNITQRGQHSQDSNTQADRNRNEGEKTNQTSRQTGHLDLNAIRTANTNGHQLNSRNESSQDNQNINSNLNNQNGEQNIDRNRQSTSTITNQSRAIASQVYTNLYLDREAKEREINNQITKLIFEESTQPLKKSKTTEDNEVHTEPSNRNVSEKNDDRWIWSDGSEVKGTTDPSTPGVDDRAAFVASQCPTGQTKINNMCVDDD